MQGDKFEEILSREQAFLTKKAPHTKYKIQYVSEYAKTWAYIASEFTLTILILLIVCAMRGFIGMVTFVLQ